MIHSVVMQVAEELTESWRLITAASIATMARNSSQTYAMSFMLVMSDGLFGQHFSHKTDATGDTIYSEVHYKVYSQDC